MEGRASGTLRRRAELRETDHSRELVPQLRNALRFTRTAPMTSSGANVVTRQALPGRAR